MKPGTERGLSPERMDLPEQLYENVLCQIFRVGTITNHAKTEIEYSTVVFVVDEAQCFNIASLSTKNQFLFGELFAHFGPSDLHDLCAMPRLLRDVGKRTKVAWIDVNENERRPPEGIGPRDAARRITAAVLKRCRLATTSISKKRS